MSSSEQDPSCRPPAGHTFLAVGQDLQSISEYFTAVEVSEHDSAAAAVMFYTDIQTLKGLESGVDYGSGIESANEALGMISGEGKGLQVGLWLNGTKGCQDILNGKLNENIKHLVHYLEKAPAYKVFLRIGYEFDNPDFGYSNPLLYRQAFTRIVNACENRPRCRQKTEFVWHSWAAGGIKLLNHTLLDYYPGDHVVDWVGISLFSQFQSKLGTKQDIKHVIDFASKHQKPVMIAESTIFGGMNKFSDPWESWFQPTLDLIEEYDIAMLSYINCDWDSQPMWKGTGFGDTRLSSNATVLDMWKQNVLDNDRFLSSGIYCSEPHHGTKEHRFSEFWIGKFVVASVFLILGAYCFRRSRNGGHLYQSIP